MLTQEEISKASDEFESWATKKGFNGKDKASIRKIKDTHYMHFDGSLITPLLSSFNISLGAEESEDNKDDAHVYSVGVSWINESEDNVPNFTVGYSHDSLKEAFREALTNMVELNQ